MPVSFPIRNPKKLMRPGAPAEPPPDAPRNEYALTIQRIMDLVAHPELFFSCNPTFAVMKEGTNRALQKLMKAGIIAPVGQKPKRRGGCGGCARRKLLSFAIQFASRFQTITLQAQKDPETKSKLESDLRAYLQRRYPTFPTDVIIVLYARMRNGRVKKVTL